MRDFLRTEVSEIKANKKNNSPKSGHQADPNASPSKVRLKGLFEGGVWKCNCKPRLPATRFQVKKDGKNHGRCNALQEISLELPQGKAVQLVALIYTCQDSGNQACNFFLWDDDAKLRERSAVMSNSKTEPNSSPEATKGREKASHNVPDPSEPSLANDFRQQAAAGGANDDFQLSPSEEKLITSFADSTQPTQSFGSSAVTKPPETPRKSIKTGPGISPGNRDRTWFEDNGGYHLSEHQFEPPDSPSPSERKKTATTPPKVQRNAGGLFSPTYTGTGPPRFHDALEWPSTSSTAPNRFILSDPSTPSKTLQGSLNPSTLLTPSRTPSKNPQGKSNLESLPDDILSTLRMHSVELTEEATQALHDICTRHVRLAKGIQQGRDVSRTAIKDREKEIIRLGHRISALEYELEVERRVTSRIQAGQTVKNSTRGGKGGREGGGSFQWPETDQQSNPSSTDSSADEDDVWDPSSMPSAI